MAVTAIVFNDGDSFGIMEKLPTHSYSGSVTAEVYNPNGSGSGMMEKIGSGGAVITKLIVVDME